MVEQSERGRLCLDANQFGFNAKTNIFPKFRTVHWLDSYFGANLKKHRRQDRMHM